MIIPSSDPVTAGIVWLAIGLGLVVSAGLVLVRFAIEKWK